MLLAELVGLHDVLIIMPLTKLAKSEHNGLNHFRHGSIQVGAGEWFRLDAEVGEVFEKKCQDSDDLIV